MEGAVGLLVAVLILVLFFYWNMQNAGSNRKVKLPYAIPSIMNRLKDAGYLDGAPDEVYSATKNRRLSNKWITPRTRSGNATAEVQLFLENLSLGNTKAMIDDPNAHKKMILDVASNIQLGRNSYSSIEPRIRRLKYFQAERSEIGIMLKYESIIEGDDASLIEQSKRIEELLEELDAFVR